MTNSLSRSQVARSIDHTLLKPEATGEEVTALISEAARLGCYSVCVSPNQLPVQTPAGLHLAVVCGFPSGAHHPQVKAQEAALSVEQGAEEVDMVINLSAAVQGDFETVEADIRAVREAIPGTVLKVIIESAALSDEQIRECCLAAKRVGADFVKTSTGFHPAGGASVHAVQLMKETVGDKIEVKASGGIRDAETAQAMIEAGATRLGCSASKAILEGFSE